MDQVDDPAPDPTRPARLARRPAGTDPAEPEAARSRPDGPAAGPAGAGGTDGTVTGPAGAGGTDGPVTGPAGAGGEVVRAPFPPAFAAAVVFVSAAAVLVLEIVALRLVAPYVGVTLQTNTAVIGAALSAIAAGAFTGGRIADHTDPGRLLGPLLLVAAALTLLTLPIVRFTGEAARGGDASATLLLAMAAVVAPAALLSAVTPMVATLQLHDLRQTGTVVGRLSGIGTFGAVVATFATGFILVAAFPTSAIVLGTGTVVALTGAAVLWQRWRTVRGAARGSLPPSLVALLPVTVLLVAVSPNPCQRETEYHCARVIADGSRPGGRTLELDTLRHSYVDLGDPLHLEYEYTRAIGAVADALRPPGEAIRALHIGGGGFTLPRYLAAARPRTRSTVLEIDGGVVELGRRLLGVDRIPGLAVRVGDARTGLREQPDRGYDLVVGDAFGGIAVPWHLTTREVAEQVRRTLRPDGVYAVNVIDYQPDRFARAEIATLRAVFGHVVMLAAPATLAGAAGGNHVLVAGAGPLALAAIEDALRRRGGWLAADEAATARYAGSARVLTDDRAPVDQLVTTYGS